MLKAQEVKKKNKKYPNKIKLYAAPRTNLRRLVSNCRFYKTKYPESWFEPSIGVGVFLICPVTEKVLIGRRVRTGLFGLPGGWLEFGEEWEDAASRELKEETGLEKFPDSFAHVFTLNCRSSLRKNQHNISCIMYTEIDITEYGKIINTEPDKCGGWIWVSVEDLRRNIHNLFYPLRDFLNMFVEIKKATDIKSLIKKRNS